MDLHYGGAHAAHCQIQYGVLVSIAKAVGRAWTASDNRAKQLNVPHRALAEAGREITIRKTVNVVENRSDTQHLVSPVAPSATCEMSIAGLKEIAGAGRYGGAELDNLRTEAEYLKPSTQNPQ